jgi:hypothetical protein
LKEKSEYKEGRRDQVEGSNGRGQVEVSEGKRISR